MIAWTLEALSGIPFARAVAAVPPGREPDFEPLLADRARAISGGRTRAASVRRAFEALAPSSGDLVCVHDAARPLVSASEVALVLVAAGRVGAAIAAMPIVDTVKQVEDDRILATLDRRGLSAAGTPQVFRAELLARGLETGRESTDEAALLEELGIPVAVVAVSRLGFKITTPEDLQMAEAVLRGRESGIGNRELRES